jgi:hypothetical protein
MAGRDIVVIGGSAGGIPAVQLGHAHEARARDGDQRVAIIRRVLTDAQPAAADGVIAPVVKGS